MKIRKALVYRPVLYPQLITYTNRKSWGCIADDRNISCHVGCKMIALQTRAFKNKRDQESVFPKKWLKGHAINAKIAEIGRFLHPRYQFWVP